MAFSYMKMNEVLLISIQSFFPQVRQLPAHVRFVKLARQGFWYSIRSNDRLQVIRTHETMENRI